jgi:hypothetical protein
MKNAIATVLLAVLCINAGAQDSLSVKRKWYMPDHLKAQFAGSIGLFSAGAGYAIFNNKTDFDFYVGYLPQRFSNDDLVTVNVKLTQPLWRINPHPDWKIAVLTTGIYLSYTFGREFSTDLPEWYPEGYYWWKESLRPNIFIGGNAQRRIRNNKSFTAVGLYYEIGTNDLKLVSYVQNTGFLSIFDILHAGVGVKLQLR